MIKIQLITLPRCLYVQTVLYGDIAVEQQLLASLEHGERRLKNVGPKAVVTSRPTTRRRHAGDLLFLSPLVE